VVVTTTAPGIPPCCAFPACKIRAWRESDNAAVMRARTAGPRLDDKIEFVIPPPWRRAAARYSWRNAPHDPL